MRPSPVVMAMVAVGYTAYYAANPHRIWGAFAALVVSCILLVMAALKGEWR